jgi:hypothetical protein
MILVDGPMASTVVRTTATLKFLVVIRLLFTFAPDFKTSL